MVNFSRATPSPLILGQTIDRCSKVTKVDVSFSRISHVAHGQTCLALISLCRSFILDQRSVTQLLKIILNYIPTGENTRKQPWNPHAQGKSQTVVATPTAQSATLSSSSKNPKTAHEFTKIWKRYCKTEEEKYQLLLKLGGNELRTIFKGEISMGLLGEFLLILNNCLNEKDSSDIFNILIGLSKTNRFDLSLKFLREEEKNAASSLIKRLEDVTSSRETFNKEVEEEKRKDSRRLLELSEIYGVTMAS